MNKATGRKAISSVSQERLGRYEVHLDRKLERMLAILLRLKDLARLASYQRFD
jgi:hypothetical protein